MKRKGEAGDAEGKREESEEYMEDRGREERTQWALITERVCMDGFVAFSGMGPSLWFAAVVVFFVPH